MHRTIVATMLLCVAQGCVERLVGRDVGIVKLFAVLYATCFHRTLESVLFLGALEGDAESPGHENSCGRHIESLDLV